MDALLPSLVAAITDGDSLHARCGDSPEHAVRLAEIDAPEKRQAFGEASRQHLAELCLHKPAEIVPKTRDQYGRTVARECCDGQDCNAAQVRAGMAWAFTKYLTDPAIKHLEDEARSARRGLWADPEPVAPWDWRHPPAAR